jgi:aryl-alcohol dehydrogenase-like predicted oxidoreductase
MVVTYGYTVRWRDRGGLWTEISVSGCSSADEAFRECYQSAKRLGYKRPSWWQLARWSTELDYEKIGSRYSAAP